MPVGLCHAQVNWQVCTAGKTCHMIKFDVATEVGFYDQSALNKHFKRCYGITPTQFARAAAVA